VAVRGVGSAPKYHVRAEGPANGPILVLTAGERHDQVALPALTNSGAIKRVGLGSAAMRPRRLVGDKGTAGQTVRAALRRRGHGAFIPRKKNERSSPALTGGLPGANGW